MPLAVSCPLRAVPGATRRRGPAIGGKLLNDRSSIQVTAEAAANIAFIKYWGAADLERAIPNNRSISMTLSRCSSRCAVEYWPEDGQDEVLFATADGSLAVPPAAFRDRVLAHLDRLRGLARMQGHFRVATRNSFPSAAGLASSASGFAALTVAAVECLGIPSDAGDLSVLARLSGSGSAARSVLGGFVEWPNAGGGVDGSAVSLADEAHWDLRDVIAIVDTQPKKISSLEGHRRAVTSPYYSTRLARLPERTDVVRQAILDRDLGRLGPMIEEEAIDLHLIAMSSRPPIFYWRPWTLAVLESVRRMRDDGVEAYATMDAGANVHVICSAGHEEQVAARLQAHEGVGAVLRDRVGAGPTVQRGHHL